MHRPPRFTLAITLAALALPLALPGAAHAGGFEFGGAGTTGLGRSGAVAARADDGMALLYNPAMLADLPGAGDIMLNAGMGFWDACVSRSGTYGTAGAGQFTNRPTLFGNPTTDDEDWIGDAYPTICNSGDPQFLPELVGTVRLTPELRLGFGLIAPNGIGNARFGSPEGTARSADGSLVPVPTRYMMAQRDLLQFFPSVGLGARITDWLRIGLTLQWGVAIVDFTNFTSTGIGSLREDPSSDIRTELNVVDPFIPAGILSVHIVPHRNVDVMFSGRLSDSVGGVVPATGTLDLTTSAFGDPAQAGGIAPERTTITGTTLSAGSPFQFTVAARYADRIRPRNYEHGPLGDLLPEVDDPMWGENFDIELDVSYLHLSQVTDFVIRNRPGSAAMLDGMPVPIPEQLPIVHGWSDAIAIRVGSDVNIVPGTFAVRAGFSWEQPLSYDFVRFMQNDFMQGFQIGLSAGATLRIDHFDISLAYSHTFGETIVVSAANANFRNVAASGMDGECPDEPAAVPPTDGATYDPARPVSSRGCYPSGFAGVVNAGTYTQEFNAFSLGLAYHFE